MTKQELLDSVSTFSFINQSLGVDDLNVTVANGGKRYRLNYLEVVGNAAQEMSKEFYVFNEGQDNEVSYWFNSEPKQSLN